MKIHWNGFIRKAIEEYPREICGFLFSSKPYSSDEEWFVFHVKNISKTPLIAWEPDRNEMHKVKAKAIKMGLTKIGNVHSHPYPKNLGSDSAFFNEHIKPSETDLNFARRHNDIVRIIILVNSKYWLNTLVHDKFGKEIKNLAVSDEK